MNARPGARRRLGIALLFWAKLYGALILFGLLASLLWRVRGQQPLADAPEAA